MDHSGRINLHLECGAGGGIFTDMTSTGAEVTVSVDSSDNNLHQPVTWQSEYKDRFFSLLVRQWRGKSEIFY